MCVRFHCHKFIIYLEIVSMIMCISCSPIYTKPNWPEILCVYVLWPIYWNKFPHERLTLMYGYNQLGYNIKLYSYCCICIYVNVKTHCCVNIFEAQRKWRTVNIYYFLHLAIALFNHHQIFSFTKFLNFLKIVLVFFSHTHRCFCILWKNA